MSKRVKFFYNGILLTVVGLAMRAAGLFLGAYVSSAIGAEGIGLQSLIMTVYSFAVTFATSGVSLSVTRLVAAAIGEGKDGEGDRILRGAFLYALFFGITASVLTYSLSAPIGMRILSDLRTVAAIRILALSLIPVALSSVISGYFVAVRRVTLNAVVQVLGQLMRIALTVILLLRFSHMGVEYAVMALAVGVTLTELVCFLIALVEFFFDRRIYKSTRVKGYATIDVAKMALPVAFSAYVRSFLLSIEHSIIPKRLINRGNTQSEALASYGYLHGMALPIILFPMTPLSSFSGLLVPEFAECEGRGDGVRMKYVAREALSKTLAYALAVSVLVYVFSEELGYVIYHSYEAGRYIAMLSPIIPIMYLDHVTDSMLKGIGEQVFSMWVNIIDALLSVMLVWVLIPIFDISGYALVIIIMEVFNFSLSFYRLNRRIPVGISIIRGVITPLISAIVSALVVDRLFDFNGNATTPMVLVIKIIFAVCLFVLLSFAFGKLSEISNREREKGAL